jgi:hypothetical protein
MENFKTTDLGIAAYLSLKGFNYSIDRTNPKKALFSFVGKDGVEINEFIKDYVDGKTLVEPIDYFNALKNVKNRLYSNL